MKVHVLLYDSGKQNEGIHSLEIKGSTIVLMFENKDDAERYCGLLEAQDFPKPSVEILDKEEITQFCIESGYEPRFIESGFVPKSEEERMFLAPPQINKDVGLWREGSLPQTTDSLDVENDIKQDELDSIRQNLEKLL
tara:strand:+ start:58 stop:471 length:414 start_codon:yes stop_codon:yes gene_type:complete